MKGFKHAFAVDPPGPATPTAREQLPVDWVCIQIAKRHLTTPGLIFLEMSRPLNWVFAQSMHVAQPFVWSIVSQLDFEGYKHFTGFLERRGSFEYIMRRIEFFEEEFARLENEGESIADHIRLHLQAVREAYSAGEQPDISYHENLKDTDESD